MHHLPMLVAVVGLVFLFVIYRYVWRGVSDGRPAMRSYKSFNDLRSLARSYLSFADKDGTERSRSFSGTPCASSLSCVNFRLGPLTYPKLGRGF